MPDYKAYRFRFSDEWYLSDEEQEDAGGDPLLIDGWEEVAAPNDQYEDIIVRFSNEDSAKTIERLLKVKGE